MKRLISAKLLAGLAAIPLLAGGLLLWRLEKLADPATLILLGGSAFLLAGVAWARRRPDAVGSPVFLLLLAFLLALAPLCGPAFNGAKRWLVFDELALLRTGPWVIVLFALGVSRWMAAQPTSLTHRLSSILPAGAAAVTTCFYAMPDAFTIVMWALGLGIVAYAAPKAWKKRLWMLALLPMVPLLLALLQRPWRVAATLHDLWLSPERDPFGRGYAVLQSGQAIERAAWFGGSPPPLLSVAHLDWYGYAHLFSQFGLAAMGAVLAALLGLLVVTLMLARQGADPAQRAMAGLFAANLAASTAPSLGLAPYLGHFGQFGSLSSGSLLGIVVLLCLAMPARPNPSPTCHGESR